MPYVTNQLALCLISFQTVDWKNFELVKDLINLLPNRDKLDYFIGMDNYFTTKKVLNFLCEEGIGFVGTARARMGWPPAEF